MSRVSPLEHEMPLRGACPAFETDLLREPTQARRDVVGGDRRCHIVHEEGGLTDEIIVVAFDDQVVRKKWPAATDRDHLD